MVGASQRRSAVRYLAGRYAVSERRGCEVTRTARSTFQYKSIRPSQESLRQKIRDLALSRVRYGYKRIHVMLKRQGIHVNKKRVYRLYCEEGLQLRPRRPRRHVTAASRQPPRAKPKAPNVTWSMDFVSDQTVDGLRFRALTVLDVFTRECLAIEPGKSLRGTDENITLGEWLQRRFSRCEIVCGLHFTHSHTRCAKRAHEHQHSHADGDSSLSRVADMMRKTRSSMAARQASRSSSTSSSGA